MNISAKLTRRATLTGMATLAATAGATASGAAAVHEVPPVSHVPPSAAPPADTFTYEVGTCVSHESHPMPSLVMCRSRMGSGRELYGVRSFAYEDPQRDRLILGTSLKVPGKRDCKECLLGATGLCVRFDEKGFPKR